MSEPWDETILGLLAETRGYEEARARDGSLDARDPVPRPEPESRVRIASADVDGTGRVPPARMMALVAAAREEHLLVAYGFDAAAVLRRDRAGWMVDEARWRSLLPLRALETVRLRTRLLDFWDEGVLVEALVLDAAARTLKGLAWLRQTWTLIDVGAPAPHPPRLAALLRQVRVGGLGEHEPSLEARARAVAAELGRGA